MIRRLPYRVSIGVCSCLVLAAASMTAAEPPVVTVSVGGQTAQGAPGQTVRVRSVPVRGGGMPFLVTAHVEGASFHGVGKDWLVLRSSTTTTAPDLLWAPGTRTNAPSSVRLDVDRQVLAPGQTARLRVYLRMPGRDTEVEATSFASGTIYLNSSPGVVTVQPDGQIIAKAIQGLEAFALVTAYHRGAIGIAQITVRATGDRDGDGLPDRWEIEHGLDPDDPADGHLDSDGDTLIARDEWRQGTDPLNSDTDRDGINDAQDPEPLVPERQAPLVRFIAPDDGASVAPGDTVAIDVAASDNGRIRAVRIYAGQVLVATLGQRPFVTTITAPDDGRERLTVRAEAEDVAGNRATVRIDLDVRSGPPGYLAAAHVAAGPNASVVRKSDGTWWSWGANGTDQLGIGAGTSPILPAEVLPALDMAKDIAIGTGFGVARFADGVVQAWGDGSSGQLGVASAPARRDSPAVVTGLAGITAVAAGSRHALALDGSGAVWAWGANAAGQAGVGDRDHVPTVRRVPVQGIIAIAAGADFSLAVDGDGVVWGWGSNATGQVAPAQSAADVLSPQPVDGLPAIVAIAAGAGHALALDAAGRIWAWGDGRHGQLAGGTTPRVTAPRQVGIAPVASIAAGGATSAALDAAGRLYMWGTDISSGSRDLVEPAVIEDLPGVVGLALGEGHALLLTRSGEVWGMGANQHRQADPRSALARVAPGRAPIYRHTVRMGTADANLSEDGPEIPVPVRRSGDMAAPLAVAVIRSGGSLSLPGDLAGLPEQVSFAVDQPELAMVLRPVQDTGIEGDESTVVRLTADGAANVGRPPTLRITVADDDQAAPLPRVAWQSTPARLAEGQSGRLIAVRSGAPVVDGLSIPLQWGGATADIDGLPAQLEFEPGSSTAIIDIVVVADEDVESEETLLVAMVPDATAVVDAVERSITLADATPGPSYMLEVVTPSCIEGEMSLPAMMRLVRTGDASTAGHVQVSIGGSAYAGSDFAMLHSDVVVPPGQASLLIPIIPYDDAEVEGDEVVTAYIAWVEPGSRIGDASAVSLLIQDNEQPTVAFASFPGRMREDERLGLFLVRTGDLRQPIDVAFTASGPAAAGRIVPLPQTVRIEAGQSQAVIDVIGVHDPAQNDSVGLTVQVQPGVGYGIGSYPPSRVDTVIADVEAIMTIGFDASYQLGVYEGGSVTLNVTARTTHGILPPTIDLALTLVEDGAVMGQDFAPPPTRLRIATQPRSTYAALALPIEAIRDAVTDPGERFSLVISETPAGFTVPVPRADLQIHEPWSVTGSLAIVEGSSGVIRVQRQGYVADSAVRLHAALLEGSTATEGADYILDLPAEITLGPTMSQVDIPVQAVADAQGEMPESLRVRLRQDGDPADGGTVVPVTIYDPLRIARVAAVTTGGQEGRNAQYRISLEGSSGNRTISYRLTGSAANTADISWATAMTGSTSVGTTPVTISVPIRTDALVEGTEDLVLELQPGVGYLIDPSAAAAAMPIVDMQDTALPLLSLQVPDALAVERSSDQGLIRIVRDGSVDQPLAVVLQPGGSGALPLPTTTVIPAGALSVDIPVTAIDDSTRNPTKQVTMAIITAPAYRLGASVAGSVTIGDDASLFSVHGDRTTIVEGDAGIAITVRRTQFLDRQSSVYLGYSVGQGSAQLVGIDAIWDFPIGVDALTRTITVSQNDRGEDLRQVTVSMYPSGEAQTTPPSTLSFGLVDDGDLATVEFAASSYSVREGAAVTVTLRRRGLVDRPAQVRWALSPDAPMWGRAGLADFAVSEGTAAFAIGQATTTFQIAAADDADSEPDEYMRIVLSPDVGTGAMPNGVYVAVGDTDAPVARFSGDSPILAYEPASGSVSGSISVQRIAGDRTLPCDVHLAIGGSGATDQRFSTTPARDGAGIVAVRIPAGSTTAYCSYQIAATPAIPEDPALVRLAIVDPGPLTAEGYYTERLLWMRDRSAAPVVIAMTTNSVSVREDADEGVMVEATLSRALASDADVRWYASGTAGFEGPTTGLIVIPAGTTTISIPIVPIDDEILQEVDGYVQVSLASTSCSIDSNRNYTQVSILDDEAREPARATMEGPQGTVRQGDTVGIQVRTRHPVEHETTVILELASGLSPMDGQSAATATIQPGSNFAYCQIRVDDDAVIGLPRRLLAVGVSSGAVLAGQPLVLSVEDRHPASIHADIGRGTAFNGHGSVAAWSNNFAPQPVYWPLETLYDDDASLIAGPLCAVAPGWRPVAISQAGYLYQQSDWTDEFQPLLEQVTEEYVDPETGELVSVYGSRHAHVYGAIGLMASGVRLAVQRSDGTVSLFSRGWDGLVMLNEQIAGTLIFDDARNDMIVVDGRTIKSVSDQTETQIYLPWPSDDARRVIDVSFGYALMSDGQLYPFNYSYGQYVVTDAPIADRIVDIAGNIALNEDGDVLAWDPSQGGGVPGAAGAARIEGVSDVVRIAKFEGAAYAMTRDGSLYTWGRGAAVRGPIYEVPRPVLIGTEFGLDGEGVLGLDAIVSDIVRGDQPVPVWELRRGGSVENSSAVGLQISGALAGIAVRIGSPDAPPLVLDGSGAALIEFAPGQASIVLFLGAASAADLGTLSVWAGPSSDGSFADAAVIVRDPSAPEPDLLVTVIQRFAQESGTQDAVIRVSRSGDLAQGYAPSWWSVRGDGDGVDFTVQPSTLSFTPGVASIDVSIHALQDDEAEGDELVWVTVPGATAWVAIADDDVGLRRIVATAGNVAAVDGDGGVWRFGNLLEPMLGQASVLAVTDSQRFMGAIDGSLSVAGVSGLDWFPRPVLGVTAVDMLSGGRGQIAMRSSNGQWSLLGSNDYGMLGNGSGVRATAPIASPVANTIAIASGWSFTLWLDAAGGLWYAGRMGYMTSTTVPQLLTPPIAVRSIFAGAFPVVVDVDGTAWRWIDNSTTTGTWVQVHAGITDLAVGRDHILLRDVAGRLWATGTGLAAGGATSLARTVPIEGFDGVVASLAAGQDISYLVTNAGNAWAWGSQVPGAGRVLNSSVPVPIRLQALRIPVSLEMDSGVLVEGGQDTGLLTVTRLDDLVGDVDVRLAVHGVATLVGDVEVRGATLSTGGLLVRIPAGQATARVELRALPDAIVEGGEPLHIRVQDVGVITPASPDGLDVTIDDTIVPGGIGRISHSP